MDFYLNDLGISNNLHHLSLEPTNNNSIDMSIIDDTMKSLSIHTSLHNAHYFEPIDTYYDYDRSISNTDTDPDPDPDPDTNTHTYVESYIEPNSEIIRENIDNEQDEIDASEDFHEYDGYDPDTSDNADTVDTADGGSVSDYIVPDDESNMIDKYDTSPYIFFGIPNKYCKNYSDDEDFIYNRYDITNDIKKYIKINNSINEYTSNFCIGNGIMIDYNNSNDDPDILYAKILYIYNYINYYYKDLKELKPNERIKHLPEHLLYWIDNIVSIFKTVINDESLKLDTFVSIEDIYFKELCYGLKIITHQLELLLNHYKSFSLWNLEDKHIKLFFKIVNNMCVIIIFMKLNNRS
jgi:hypothetical protein